MPTAEHCRSMAEEADRLAAVVSYARDKARLRQQAQAWRVKAQSLEAETEAPLGGDAKPRDGVMGWLRRRVG